MSFATHFYALIDAAVQELLQHTLRPVQLSRLLMHPATYNDLCRDLPAFHLGIHVIKAAFARFQLPDVFAKWERPQAVWGF